MSGAKMAARCGAALRRWAERVAAPDAWCWSAHVEPAHAPNGCELSENGRAELPRDSALSYRVGGLRRGAHGQAPGWPIKNATPAVHTAAFNQQSEPPGIKPHTATASKEWKAAKAYSIASIAIDE
jgi:hypothetical protein